MEQTYSAKQIIIIMVVILAVILVFYGITILVNNNKSDSFINNDSNVTIQYDEILVGEIFKQNNQDYYVLAYDDTNEGQQYKSEMNTYILKENSLRTYLIDLTNGFNKKYVATESNFDGEFPIFKETTLLRITDGKIVEKSEGDSISDKLSALNEE